MRDTDLAQFSVRDAARIARVVQQSERRKLTIPGEQPYAPRPDEPTWIMYLDDCQSGQTAKAARLTRDESTGHQLLTINGDPPADATFKIEWSLEEVGDNTTTLVNPESILHVSAFATPEELLARFAEFTFLGRDEIQIQCGTHERPVSRIDPETGLVSAVYSPLRWIVTFRGTLAGRELPLMRLSMQDGSGDSWPSSAKSKLYDTGETIDVLSGTPTGQTIRGTTILKRGAIGVAIPIDEGWGLVSLEPRSVDY